MPQIFLDVDPRTLHLPWARAAGADPFKLARQIAKYGKSSIGMPVVLVSRGADGEYVITDGVTRATRIAKLSPGAMMRVEVIDHLKSRVGHLPTVGDRIP